MKKILLVTTVRTGAGHKSISDALTEQFAGIPDVEIKTIDGFELPGRIGMPLSSLYGTMTRRVPKVYDMAWRITMKHPPAFRPAARLCRRRFEECLRGFHPDLILTVHSCFNVVLTRMLERLGLNIPVVVLQADLINIHSTWCNPRAYRTICLTREAYDASILQGMPADKLQVMQFPVRSRFCEAAKETDSRAYTPSRSLRCLMMSGGEGTGHVKAYAESILKNTDAELTVVCGRNGKLENRLARGLGRQYGSRMKVLGFVTDPEQKMLRSDLLVTRASPNTLSEAIVMAVPLIVIGPMPAQEKDNPTLISKYNLGVVSESPGDIPRMIRDLLDNDAERLTEIRDSQRSRRSFESARKIAVYVAELAEPLDYTI